MRRRPSNSALDDEVDDDNVRSVLNASPGNEREGTGRTAAERASFDALKPLERTVSHRNLVLPNALSRESSREPQGSTLESSRDVRVLAQDAGRKEMDDHVKPRRLRPRSPWSCSLSTLLVTVLSLAFLSATVHSFLSRQVDVKGCRMSYMRPAFAKLSGFDTEHTRFASKYSLYLYREGGIDEDTKVLTLYWRSVDLC